VASLGLKDRLCQWMKGSAKCPSSARHALAALPRSKAAIVELGGALPRRECQDILNFRGNGPEDARLLPLTTTRALVVYNDYAEAAGGAVPFRRTIYVRDLVLQRTENGGSRAVLGPIMRVLGGTAEPPLGDIEKNWAPFARTTRAGSVEVFVHRWLDRKGEAIVHRLVLDKASATVGETLLSSNGKLREVIGGPHHTEISGGTSAVLLNESHFVAFGHTMTMPCALPEIKSQGKEAKRRCLRKNQWRAYALFAYVFESTPPFRLVAATPEFRIVPPTGKRIYGYGLGPPAPAITRPTEFVLGSLGKPQFPVGLSIDKNGRYLLLSTGFRDLDTILSWVKVDHLMQQMKPLH